MRREPLIQRHVFSFIIIARPADHRIDMLPRWFEYRVIGFSIANATRHELQCTALDISRLIKSRRVETHEIKKVAAGHSLEYGLIRPEIRGWVHRGCRIMGEPAADDQGCPPSHPFKTAGQRLA